MANKIKIKNPTMLYTEAQLSEEFVELLRMNKDYLDKIFKDNNVSSSSKEFIDNLEIVCNEIMYDLKHLG